MDNVILIAAVSFTLSLVNNGLLKLLLKSGDIERKAEELKAFKTERAAAERLKDQKALKKLDKQRIYISQIEKDVASFNFKMMIVNIATSLLPFFILIYFIRMWETAGYLSAFLFQSNMGIPVTFYIWYTICIFFFTLLFRKIFNIRI